MSENPARHAFSLRRGLYASYATGNIPLPGTPLGLPPLGANHGRVAGTLRRAVRPSGVQPQFRHVVCNPEIEVPRSNVGTGQLVHPQLKLGAYRSRLKPTRGTHTMDGPNALVARHAPLCVFATWRLCVKKGTPRGAETEKHSTQSRANHKALITKQALTPRYPKIPP